MNVSKNSRSKGSAMLKKFRFVAVAVSAGLACSLLVWPPVTVDGRGLVLLLVAIALVLTADRGVNAEPVEETKWTKPSTAGNRRR